MRASFSIAQGSKWLSFFPIDDANGVKNHEANPYYNVVIVYCSLFYPLQLVKTKLASIIVKQSQMRGSGGLNNALKLL